jgi:hypothetical protein
MGAVLYYAWVARNQWDAMVVANNLTRQSQRPWVGVSAPFTLSTPPRSRATNPNSANISADWTFKAKNYGSAPAFSVLLDISLWVSNESVRPDHPGSPVAACPIGGRKITGLPGDVIFPAIERIYEDSSQIGFPTTVSDRYLWIIGCIAYLDSTKSPHRTRFWFRSPLQDPPRFEPWGQEADWHKAGSHHE